MQIKKKAVEGQNKFGIGGRGRGKIVMIYGEGGRLSGRHTYAKDENVGNLFKYLREGSNLRVRGADAVGNASISVIENQRKGRALASLARSKRN